MFQPFLENTAKTIQYIVIWVVYALLHTAVMYSLTDLPIDMLVLDGLVHAAFFGLIGMLLWISIKYGNYSVLNRFQRLVNFVALGFLSIGLWLATGYGLLYWGYGAELSSKLVRVMPAFGFIGLLIYLLMIQRFRQQLEDMLLEKEINEPAVTVQELPETEELQKKPAETEVLERIAVKSGSKIHVVLVPEILYLQADGDYVQIFTTNGKYLKEQTMKYFEEHLPETQFVRVHRSIIVNVEMISRIELYEKQSQQLTLKNGQQIKTSPAGYKALRAALSL